MLFSDKFPFCKLSDRHGVVLWFTFISRGWGRPRSLYFSCAVQHFPDRCSSLSLLSPILSFVVHWLVMTLSRTRWWWSLVFPCYRDLWVPVPLCLLWSWSSRALQARVGRRHSTQAAEHVIPFFTQGGGGEWLPSDCYKQSHCCQRSQPQGPGYVFCGFVSIRVHLHELGNMLWFEF